MTIYENEGQNLPHHCLVDATLAGFNLLAAKEPLYDGLGSYSRKVTTDSAEAQRYFDQGLAFLHGFNHRAAMCVSASRGTRSGMCDGALGRRARVRSAH
jgi:hypothetical protein